MEKQKRVEENTFFCNKVLSLSPHPIPVPRPFVGPLGVGVIMMECLSFMACHVLCTINTNKPVVDVEESTHF